MEEKEARKYLELLCKEHKDICFDVKQSGSFISLTVLGRTDLFWNVISKVLVWASNVNNIVYLNPTLLTTKIGRKILVNKILSRYPYLNAIKSKVY